MTARCATCYRREDATHRVLGRCPDPMPRPTPVPVTRTRRGYVPPSRANRASRDEYLDTIRVTPEHKRAMANARQRRYRQRQAVARAGAAS